jgi:hypothetical protein
MIQMNVFHINIVRLELVDSQSNLCMNIDRQ